LTADFTDFFEVSVVFFRWGEDSFRRFAMRKELRK
jgi:hypothetical protein